MTPALVALRDVVKIYGRGRPNEVRAVDGISFDIARGSFCAIVGESGSGKTTLMHLLGALDVPSAGSITIEERDIAACTRGELARLRARRIGFIFQGFNLIPTHDALENVLLAARYARQPEGAARERARELLATVGLGDRMKHRPGELSGGQQQRVAIARALINDPALLLADEPTGELDSANAAAILDLLENVRAERGVTLVVVTHSPAVWKRAQRVVHLVDGRIGAIDDR